MPTYRSECCDEEAELQGDPENWVWKCSKCRACPCDVTQWHTMSVKTTPRFGSMLIANGLPEQVKFLFLGTDGNLVSLWNCAAEKYSEIHWSAFQEEYVVDGSFF